jgi:hypothetical protein
MENANKGLPCDGLSLANNPLDTLGGIRYRWGGDVQRIADHQRDGVDKTRGVCENEERERREGNHGVLEVLKKLKVFLVLRAYTELVEAGGLGEALKVQLTSWYAALFPLGYQSSETEIRSSSKDNGMDQNETAHA